MATAQITSAAAAAAAPLTTAPPILTAALTTTFTPPAQCAENHLTMLVGSSENIWVNEPEPLPNSKVSSCYPTQWIGGYSSEVSKSSSVAPFMSPLVCPSGWNTESSTWSDGYIACCAPGFTFAAPTKTADPERLAYGGTCYSNFALQQTATVTVYNAQELSTTVTWVAETTPAQAYAHPIDGIAADYTPGISKSVSPSRGTHPPAAEVTGDSAAPRRAGGGPRAAVVVGLLLASLAVW